jgi:hypothetical protein
MDHEGVARFVPEPEPEPVPRAEGDPRGLPASVFPDAATRAGQVLAELDRQLRALTRIFEVDIVSARQVGSHLVEVVYRHPSYDGLLGLRRDVGEREVGVPPDDPHHALAVHENSVHEVATMLRVELEEPLGTARTTTDAAGIRWWGEPAGS